MIELDDKAQELQADVLNRTAELVALYHGNFEPGFFASPISYPEMVVEGRFKITHRQVKSGEKLPIISTRDSLFSNRRITNAVAPHPFVIHQLYEKEKKDYEFGNLWMTDQPSELNQAHEAIHVTRPHGDVLIGGLGLGILTTLVSYIPGIRSITTVEISAGIITLTGHGLLGRIINMSIQDFIQTTNQKFDFVFLDTWRGQSENDYWREVFPLKRAARNKFGDIPVWCWMEDQFAAQAYRSLRQQPQHWYHTKLKGQMDHDEAVFFLTQVGTKAWEDCYGSLVKR